MTPAAFEGIQENKKSATFIRRSNKAEENRIKTADKDGLLKATSHFGSISTLDYMDRLGKYFNYKAASQEADENVADNEAFLNASDYIKHSKVHRLGAASTRCFQPTPTTCSIKLKGNADATYVPGVCAQLQEEQEKSQKLEERFEKFQLEMAAKFASPQYSWILGMTPQNRGPRDPSQDGSGGINAGVGLSGVVV